MAKEKITKQKFDEILAERIEYDFDEPDYVERFNKCVKDLGYDYFDILNIADDKDKLDDLNGEITFAMNENILKDLSSKYEIID